MNLSEGHDSVWVEERSFIFDCLVRVLTSMVVTHGESLSILVTALLVHNLGEWETCDAMMSEVEAELRELPDVLDSGMQIRDCLVAASYYYVARKIRRDILPVEHILLPRINFAAKSQWFGDSQLALMVALIANEVQVGTEARDYLENKVDLWLKDDYVLGILHYCLTTAGNQVSISVRSYLQLKDWSNCDLLTLSLALIVFGKLGEGYGNGEIQYSIARNILKLLGDSELLQDAMPTGEHPSRTAARQFTLLDFAIAAYVLRSEGYDTVIGVPRRLKDTWNSLLKLQKVLSGGGQLVPKWQLVVGETSFVMLVAASTVLAFRLAGRQSLLEFLAESAASLLISSLFIWFWRRSLPSGALLTYLPETAPQIEAGENREH
jgi:hypothetical protein